MAQNGTSNRTGLPNGMVPFHQIPDPQTREAVMKLNENIAWLAKRPAGSGRAEAVVEYKDAQNLLDSIEANYPNAAEAASAIPQVLAAKTAAEGASSSATASAASATASAESASSSAESATASASSAASSAERAAAFDWSTAFCHSRNVATNYSSGQYSLPIASIVPDASLAYHVVVDFVCEARMTTGSRYFKISTDKEDAEKTREDYFTASSDSPKEIGDIVELEMDVLGSDVLYILNGGSSSTATSGASTYWTVYVKISKLPQAAAEP